LKGECHNAYKVSLTFVSGISTQRTEIEYGRTPNVGDIIRVDFADGVAKALVSAVRKLPTMDQVDAQEM